jgi:riboflavin kinase/FMN adenylyltransferase
VLSFESVSELPKDLGSTVVTIGKFDGIHVGHQALLAKTLELSEDQMLAPVVVTFDRHPGQVIHGSETIIPILGKQQKQELIAESGIEMLLTLAFDEELAKLSARDFVSSVLVNNLHARAVVVGSDFKFGAGQSGDVATLRELGAEFGFVVNEVPSVLVDGEKVSTTKIRALLDSGNVRGASMMLGRLHSTRGMVEHGLKIGRKLGFPTANISRDAEGLLPKDGVYAGWLHAQGERYPAALSIGINETIVEVPRLLEVHVLDRNDLDLYDQVVDVEYVDFIRPALKFNGVDELIAAINADLDKIRQILG